MYSFRGYGHKLFGNTAAVVRVVSKIPRWEPPGLWPAGIGGQYQLLACVVSELLGKGVIFLHLSENKENSVLCVILLAGVFLCLKNSISFLMGTI